LGIWLKKESLTPFILITKAEGQDNNPSEMILGLVSKRINLASRGGHN